MPEFPVHPHVRRLPAVPHGGAAQLLSQGLDPQTLDDFSASILPMDPPAPVRRALATADPRAYPDPACTALRRVLAERYAVAPDQVLCANGSVALIEAVARACLGPGRTALVVGPTFGEYAAAARTVGADVVEVRTVDVDALLAAVAEHRPAIVFLCTPNNPTGQRWSDDALDRIAAAAPLVIDEAYAGFLRPPPPPAIGPGRVVLRSLTKDHALAGLRIGCALGDPAVLRLLERLLTPWGVSSLAQAAARAALLHPEPYRAAIDALWRERRRLIDAIEALGFAVDARDAPFFLVDVGDAPAMTRQLLDAGIVVRDCSSFGLPRQIRISPQRARAGDRLLSALRGARRPAHL